MSPLSLRRTTGAVSAGSLVLLCLGVPVSAAPSGSATVGTQVEAWYSTTTTEACTELDCSMLPPASTYPEDTLHVGINAGKPAAATFLELDLFGTKLPAGAKIDGGTLTLPVDTAPADGSLEPETAKLVVCHVTDFFFDTKGSLAKPPKTDCATSAPANFTAEPQPVFTVDVAPFATKWASGDSAALAVLPAPEAESGKATWHVTFWGKENSAEGAKPITAELSYSTGSSDGSISEAPLPPLPSAPEPFDDGGLAPAPAPPIDLPEPADAPAAAEPPAAKPPAPAAAPEVQAMPELRTFGYPYPIAWTMPLLLLIGFGFTGRALTKRLEPIA